MPNILTATIWQYFKSSIANRPTDCVTSPLINNIAAIASSFILPRRGGDTEGERAPSEFSHSPRKRGILAEHKVGMCGLDPDQ